MQATQSERKRPVRVVLFCGGPGLERGLVEFVRRLEEHPQVEFLGGFCESSGHSLRARAVDAWKRRGVLAAAVLLANGLDFLTRACSDPRSELGMRRRAAEVAGRIQIAPDLHAADTVDKVRSLDPDLGLVYGGPILKPRLFELPRLGTLGIHHGKVPDYRGKKTTFWAMHNGEPTAGVTIQRLNRGIDTGDVVARGEVTVGRKSLGAVWSELEALGVELYVQAVLDVGHGKAHFQPQEGKRGKLYRDPRARDILRFAWKQLMGQRPRSKPAVCMLTETYYPAVGGGETQARLLAAELADRGVGVTLVTRLSDPRLARLERDNNVTVHRVGPSGPEHLKKWGLLLTATAALVRLEREYDLVLVSGFRILGVPAVLMSKLLRKRCILKADSMGEMSGEFFHAGLNTLGLSPSSPVFKTLLRLRNAALGKADAYIAISTDVAAELEASGVDRQKIHSIPNGFDAARFHPVSRYRKLGLRRRLGLPPDQPIVTYAGRLVRYKGLPMLLEVWRRMADSRSDLVLLLVGGGGLDIHNCERELREYVRAHQLQGRVRFTGNVENVHEYLQASDIFVFPTESEAFGLALVEAMACGLPVVSTAVGGAKDLITHGMNGALVRPGDREELQEALNGLLTNPSKVATLGRAAADTVRGRYAREAIGDQYERLLDLVHSQLSRAS